MRAQNNPPRPAPAPTVEIEWSLAPDPQRLAELLRLLFEPTPEINDRMPS